ncbi:MAG TPA: hypothetical protein VJ250_07550, partial [Nitrososphaeraceae archaeon]|nr:hypothetical protein [Nitrososphaeraceae archaeon]
SHTLDEGFPISSTSYSKILTSYFIFTITSFPIQYFGTTTWPLLPDEVTTFSICFMIAFILLTMIFLRTHI